MGLSPASAKGPVLWVDTFALRQAPCSRSRRLCGMAVGPPGALKRLAACCDEHGLSVFLQNRAGHCLSGIPASAPAQLPPSRRCERCRAEEALVGGQLVRLARRHAAEARRRERAGRLSGHHGQPGRVRRGRTRQAPTGGAYSGRRDGRRNVDDLRQLRAHRADRRDARHRTAARAARGFRRADRPPSARDAQPDADSGEAAGGHHAQRRRQCAAQDLRHRAAAAWSGTIAHRAPPGRCPRRHGFEGRGAGFELRGPVRRMVQQFRTRA